MAKCANNCIVLQRRKLRACKWAKRLKSRIPFAWLVGNKVANKVQQAIFFGKSCKICLTFLQ